jgi:capsular exopolysaccharide synthesis family protein
MSRIQDILNKAEREGAVRRTVAQSGPQVSTLDPAPVTPPPARETPEWVAERHRSDMRPAAAARVARGVVFDRLMVAARAPHGDAAEQYRTLRTRIAQSENGHARRVLVVTSPAQGDGKSVTASNLALTMAQEFGRRTVLMDADLRRPGVHALLGVPLEPGLTEVLRGEVSLDEALVEIADVNLTVLPAGRPADRPAELLGTTAMRRTLDALRSRFDRVLIDTPPVLPLADVGVLAPYADGVLLVVRAGATPKPLIERALASFDTGRLLGVVLNDGGSPDETRYAAPRA